MLPSTLSLSPPCACIHNKLFRECEEGLHCELSKSWESFGNPKKTSSKGMVELQLSKPVWISGMISASPDQVCF
jgi:hypothetical protein